MIIAIFKFGLEQYSAVVNEQIAEILKVPVNIGTMRVDYEDGQSTIELKDIKISLIDIKCDMSEFMRNDNIRHTFLENYLAAIANIKYVSEREKLRQKYANQALIILKINIGPWQIRDFTTVHISTLDAINKFIADNPDQEISFPVSPSYLVDTNKCKMSDIVIIESDAYEEYELIKKSIVNGFTVGPIKTIIKLLNRPTSKADL